MLEYLLLSSRHFLVNFAPDHAVHHLQIASIVFVFVSHCGLCPFSPPAAAVECAVAAAAHAVADAAIAPSQLLSRIVAIAIAQ